MPQHVFFVHWVAVQSLLRHKAIDIIVVIPVLVTCVIREINKDTVHFTRITG